MLLLCVGMMVFSISAQRAKGVTALAPDILISSPTRASVNLDHCTNGLRATPEPCVNNADFRNWVNGNANPNKAHYREGDSVPFRSIFSGLTVGTVYTLEIFYDVTKNGKYAFDYLTSFDRTERGPLTPPSGGQADPCSDVIPGCSPLAPTSSAFITDDPNVPLNNDSAQDFDIWGGSGLTFAYSGFEGTLAGTSTTFVTLTFTATAETAVLAWGGHVATRADRGANNSAVGISGSPYHMALSKLTEGGNVIGIGSQDHQLSVSDFLTLDPTAASVFVSGRVTNSFGRGISGARIAVLGANGEAARSVLTNQFGYYKVSELDAGSTYTSIISHRRYQFTDNIRTFTLNDNLSDNDFVANP